MEFLHVVGFRESVRQVVEILGHFDCFEHLVFGVLVLGDIDFVLLHLFENCWHLGETLGRRAQGRVDLQHSSDHIAELH